MNKDRTCIAEGCNKKWAARKLCCMHYQRLRTHGDLNKRSKKGRPANYKVSEQTKKKISESKTGLNHTIEARENIAVGVKEYYKGKYPISADLAYVYGDSFSDWIEDNADEINEDDSVLTYSRLRTVSRTETPVGGAIEWLAVENVTPELLVLWKEAMEEAEECEIIL